MIGGGIAGLSAALTAAEAGKSVIVACKGMPTWSQSVMAQGGINAELGGDPESHAIDTLKGGGGIGNPEAAAILAQEAPEAVRWLDRLGVLFDRDEDGLLRQRPFGGGSHPRACYAGDRTGHQILHILYHHALSHPKITLLSHRHLIELIAHDGRIQGAWFLPLLGGKIEVILAQETIIATGGYARLWTRSTNARGSSGDGITAAYRAGAALRDLEFVQFHPTALEGSGILLSEAARGEGAVLVNDLGERFVNELATRDLVARAIHAQLLDGRRVFLDMRPIGASTIEQKLPQELALCLDFAGLDPRLEPIPVAPAAHYTIGGIAVDTTGQSSLEGLWACGEAACNGLHGANRLGGNSLAEAVVFGRRTAAYAASTTATSSNIQPQKPSWLDELRNLPPANLSSLINDLGTLMEHHAGIIRTLDGLDEGITKALALEQQSLTLGPTSQSNRALGELLEFRSLALLARLTLEAARARPTSIGAHYIVEGV
ncbi:MAG: FAD-dependent oxidoreductase [Campylobacterales bacterium]